MERFVYSSNFREGVRSTELELGEGHDHAIVSIYIPKVVEEEDEDTSAPEAPDAPESDTASDDDAGEDEAES